MSLNNKYTTKAWAFFVKFGKIDQARQWLSQMKNERLDEMQGHMKMWNMQYYEAWLQTAEDGAWIFERWQTPQRSFDDITHQLQTIRYPFIDWCMEWKKELHDGQFNRLNGVRHLFNFSNDKQTKQSKAMVSTQAVDIETIANFTTTLDSWGKKNNAPIKESCKHSGLQTWQAWLEEIDGQHFLLQYFAFNESIHFNKPIKIESPLTKEPIQFELIHKNSELLASFYNGGFIEKIKLYPSEIESLYWAARGKTAEESAMILGLTTHTVASYRKSAIQKLNANNITHAVSLAYEQGLILSPAI